MNKIVFAHMKSWRVCFRLRASQYTRPHTVLFWEAFLGEESSGAHGVFENRSGLAIRGYCSGFDKACIEFQGVRTWLVTGDNT